MGLPGVHHFRDSQQFRGRLFPLLRPQGENESRLRLRRWKGLNGRHDAEHRQGHAGRPILSR